MPSRIFEFTGSQGQKLVGRIDLPYGPPTAYALFAHCFTCTKESLAAVRISRALAERGIAVLRFDFTGLGQSGGDFAEAGFSSDIADLVAGANAMLEAGMPPALLIGHSLGGAAVLAAALELPGIAAVATIAAPSDVHHVSAQFGESVQQIMEQGEAEVHLGGRPFTVRRSFLEDLDRHDQKERVARLRRPLLILHSPRDEVVGIEHATALFMAARHPKSFVSLNDADHLLTNQRDAEFAASMIAAWASHYVPAMPESEAATSIVTAEHTGAGKFQTRIHLRGGAILADEPVEVGGLATGPTPYELLSAGLAGCTSMTLQIYSGLKGITLPPYRVEVTHSDQPGDPPHDVFTREIVFEEELDSDRREKLLKIANRCPVHRTLERRSEIVTGLTGRAEPGLTPEPAGQHVQDMVTACKQVADEGN